MAKVFRIHENGGPSVLCLEIEEVGAPGPGEVRLIQHAVGINAVDALVREGLYPMTLPAIPGFEGAGVIDSVGAGVTGFAVGDRVAYFFAEGGYATGKLAWHTVPDLPEAVVAGREGVYLDWFYTSLTFKQAGISRDARNQHVEAYTGVEAMRGGFEHYRAFATTTAQGREASQRRLTMPVLALGGELVGDVLYQQMSAVADTVTGGKISGCGHVIQEEQPGELLSRLRAFL